MARKIALTPPQQRARSWALRYRRAVWQMENLNDELAELRVLGERITRTINGMPGRRQEVSQAARAVEQIEVCTRRLERQALRCVQEQQAVARTLDRLEDARLRRLLALRYLKGRSWQEIGDELHVTERWVRTMHARGLDALAALLPAEPEAAREEPGQAAE